MKTIQIYSMISAGILPDCCGEDKAELESKTLDLPVSPAHVATFTSDHEVWLETKKLRY